MAPSDPRPLAGGRRDRWILAAGGVSIIWLSAISSPGALLLAAAAAAAVLRRGSRAAVARTARCEAPVTAALALASWALTSAVQGAWPDGSPFLALAIRATLIAFVTFSVLARVDLLVALAPWPTAARLAVVTLVQIQALRLLAAESALGLRSRLPRRSRAIDVVRGAGGITGALVVLSARNARDVADALRARGAP